jgi:2-polyprenyl-3-methyl-5-hydroxy-6-metoxy-1,4-benzoquinol methylase
VIGLDYDQDKIAVADHCFSKNEQLTFLAADATQCELPKSDAFVLSDILHYIPGEAQEKLLVKCMQNLNPGGMILLRDADKDLEKRHLGTRYTEFFSTNFGFNKATNKLEFVSSAFITDIIRKNNMHIEKIDNTKLTSNIIYIIKQN